MKNRHEYVHARETSMHASTYERMHVRTNARRPRTQAYARKHTHAARMDVRANARRPSTHAASWKDVHVRTQHACT